MKHVHVSATIRTALLWLLDHVKPSEQPSEQALISYGAELERQRYLPKGFIPAIYEPPEKTTDPTQEIHQLVETGRITALIHTQKLPRFKVHKTTLNHVPAESDAQADKWLLDSEPKDEEPEEEDEDATEKYRALTQLKHEGRGKAS